MHVLDLSERDLRVLVVNDDVVVPTLLAIERPDLVVDEVTRAVDVMPAIRASMPDAVVIDRSLPDADGVDVIRRLRCGGPTQQLPVLVAGKVIGSYEQSVLLRAGADGWLSTPFDSEQLVQAIRGLLALAPAELRVRRQRHLDQLVSSGSTPGLTDLPVVIAPVAEAAAVRRRRWWRKEATVEARGA